MNAKWKEEKNWKVWPRCSLLLGFRSPSKKKLNFFLNLFRFLPEIFCISSWKNCETGRGPLLGLPTPCSRVSGPSLPRPRRDESPNRALLHHPAPSLPLCSNIFAQKLHKGDHKGAQKSPPTRAQFTPVLQHISPKTGHHWESASPRLVLIQTGGCGRSDMWK